MRQLCAVILCIAALFQLAIAEEEGMTVGEDRARAKVIKVEALEPPESDFIVGMENVTVEITHGQYKGEILVIENAQSGNPAYDLYAQVGDQVVLLLEVTASGIQSAYIEDYYRLNIIYILGAVFIGLILWIGRGQGLRAILTLGITIALVFKVLVPLALRGFPPVFVAMGIATAAIIITFLVISGVNSKSLCAILGTTGGVLLAGILAAFSANLGHLTGMSAQEAQMLMYAPQQLAYDFKGLLLAGIIIGALGAIMDIGMSIASSMYEIKHSAQHLSRAELLKAGLRVGRDVMGTMTNTLILAYAGTSLPLLMLFMAYEIPLIRVMNMDIIASEIVRALCGSIGLICAIPLTALIASLIYKQNEINQ